ncbi:MAG: hypothetical protein H0T42_33145 [Deltaproteobacteria bacterium]|nr:hypothetical protein [Deltaproteobacteria bacterium]
MRAWVICLVVAALAACKGKPARNLDLDRIRVISNATLRTDQVSGGPGMPVPKLDAKDPYATTTTFVLVDAENGAGEGAYVTLGGELTDDRGEVIGRLKPQSLWVPAGERRLFALVDDERKERPASTSARIVVRGALVPDSPPRARIEQLHVFDDHGKTVVQANLVNDADRIGKVVVISAFHDQTGRPMTRPFQIVEIDRNQTKPVQFVGPPGSKTGTIFVGDAAY